MVACAYYDSDNRVRRYAETLTKEGWKVDVFVLRQNNQDANGRLKGVGIHRIQKRGLREKGKLSYLFYLLRFFASSMVHISLFCLKNRCEIVHVHSVPDFEVFATILPKLMGSKVILDIHDIVPELYLNKFNLHGKTLLFKALTIVEKLSTGFADHVIIANHIWHNRLVARRSTSENKCSVIINYPDPEIFFPRTKDRIDSKFVLICPSTLSVHQGVETAIRAMHLIRGFDRGIELHIYGKGTDEDYFKRIASELQLADVVFFKGLVPLEDVAAAMSNADIGIEPKLSNVFSDEAFSTKILEFMLMGLPVIASETTAHKYYIDKSLVKYYPPGDAKSLADAILSLRSSPHFRRELVENGLKFIAKNNWNVRKTEYINLVTELLGE